MASPVPQTAAAATGNSATPTITEPASAASGDLLYAIVGSADPGTAITGLTGWTQLGEGDDSQGNRFWYGWIIRGASAPDLVAAAANAHWHTSCVRITGHDATTPIGSDHGTFSSSGTGPNPPNVDPGSSRDHLSIASVLQEGKNTPRFTPPTTPGTYTEQTDLGSSGGGAGTAHIAGTIATRPYTGQAEDPGNFASTRSDGYTAITVLVRPVAGTDYTESKTEAVGITDSTPVKQSKVRSEAVGVGDVVDRVHDAERVRTEPVGITDLVTTAMTKVRTEAPYFSIPGTSGHYVSTPSTAAWNLSGTDITFEFDVQSPDWDHPGSDNPRWLAKDNVSGNGRSWGFLTQGIELGFSAFDDSGALINTYNSTSLVLVDDERITIRVEVDIDNGSGGSDVHFYRNGVFVETVTFGTPLTGANAINPDGTTEVRLGARGDDADFFLGNFYRVRVWTDLTKTTLFADFDPSDFDIGDTDTATAVGAGGFTWTINGVTSVIGPVVRVTDSVAVQITKQRSKAEPVGVSDSTPVKQGKAVTEPVGVADTVDRVHTAERTATEPVGVGDQVDLAQGKEVAEAVGVTDATEVKITKQRSKAEPVGVSDTVLPAQTHRVTITESIGIADATTRDLDSQRVVTEPVGITDGTPIKQGKRISEAVGVADSTLDVLTGDTVEVVTEPVGISDATQRQIDAVRAVVEPVGIFDTVLPAKTIRVTITESVGVADATAPAKTARVVITEAMGVADVVARQANWKRSVTEAMGVADVVTFVGGTSFVGIIGGLRSFTNLGRATVKVERTSEDKTR